MVANLTGLEILVNCIPTVYIIVMSQYQCCSEESQLKCYQFNVAGGKILTHERGLNYVDLRKGNQENGLHKYANHSIRYYSLVRAVFSSLK